MRTILIVFAAMLATIGGVGASLFARPEYAQDDILTAFDRLASYSTEFGRTILGVPQPSLAHAWSEVMDSRVRSGSTPRSVEKAMWSYERAVVRELREMANNPASFSVVDLRRARGSRLCITFRATNGFNALVLGKALAIGSVVFPERVSDQSFDREWNRICS